MTRFRTKDRFVIRGERSLKIGSFDGRVVSVDACIEIDRYGVQDEFFDARIETHDVRGVRVALLSCAEALDRKGGGSVALHLRRRGDLRPALVKVADIARFACDVRFEIDPPSRVYAAVQFRLYVQDRRGLELLRTEG